MITRFSVRLVFTAAIALAGLTQGGGAGAETIKKFVGHKGKVEIYDQSGNRAGTVEATSLPVPAPVLAKGHGDKLLRIDDSRWVHINSVTLDTTATVATEGCLMSTRSDSADAKGLITRGLGGGC